MDWFLGKSFRNAGKTSLFLAHTSGNCVLCLLGHSSDESLSTGMLTFPHWITVKLMVYLCLLLLLILSSGLCSRSCISDMEIEAVDLKWIINRLSGDRTGLLCSSGVFSLATLHELMNELYLKVYLIAINTK